MNQFYDPEILGKEYVMRGNAAILKCTIPSFVADFVQVVAWIDDEEQEYLPSREGNFSGGKTSSCLWIYFNTWILVPWFISFFSSWT